MDNTVYKLGDWLINKQTRQIYEIVGISLQTDLISVKNTCNKTSTSWWLPLTISQASNDFSYLDKNCPAAQLLYNTKV